MRFGFLLSLVIFCHLGWAVYPPATVAQIERARGLLIDTRESALFNGWSPRGSLEKSRAAGHERGARNLAASWLPKLDETFFRERYGDLTNRTLGLYGDEEAVKKVGQFLEKMGARKIRVVTDALREHKRLVRLPNYQKLPPAWWLADLQAGKKVEAAPTSKPLVFEVAWGPPKDYLQAHIPGAGYIDTDLLEEGPVWNKLDDTRLKKNILALGLTQSTPVILYARNTMSAARVAWVLMYAGLRDVRLLDGGWQAWEIAGLPREKGPPPKASSASEFGGVFAERANFSLSLDQAQQLLKKRDGVLVSVRSWPEFIGERSGYEDISAKGDIPGAVWGRAGSDANHLEDYRNPDNTMRSANEIQAFWRASGVVPEKQVAFYCGTGWRASEAFFYAFVMGWRRISVYDGGWKEWSLDSRRPVAVGPR